jgi:phage I-like protein
MADSMAHQFKVRSDDALSTSADAVIQDDGSLWSHAATLGKRVRGDSTFDITRDTVENFIRVFKNVPGYRKLCIDYEHGTVNGATDKGEPVPQAGTVLELKGVYAESDFTGSLKIAAEKLTKAAGRTLGDARNFGLWVRWKPTEKAKAYVRAGEITEMSIAFQDNVASNADGSLQGPGLLSIALTNLPFLDDMVPVAASRESPEPPEPRGDHMTQTNRVLALVGTFVGSPVSTEDEAVTALTAQQPEITRIRTFAKDVGAALGETDPDKAVAKLRALSAEVTQFKAKAEEERKARIEGDIAATWKKFEDRVLPLTNPDMAFYADGLRAELLAGTTLEDCKAYKAVNALKPHGITEKKSAADNGQNPTEDTQLVARVTELMKTPEFKQLTRDEGYTHAFNRACEQAEEEMATQS